MRVVEIGPVGVRGPGQVDVEQAEAAVEFIDDPMALVGERPVPVDELLAAVLAAAAGPGPGPLLLVHPGWWPAARRARLAAAAGGDVTCRTRTEVLLQRYPAAGTVVEIGAADVAVLRAERVVALLERDDRAQLTAAAVATAIGAAAGVVLDAPADVPGARILAEAIAGRLADRGIAVHRPDPGPLVPPRPPARRARRWPASVPALLAAAACGAAALIVEPPAPPVAEPATLLVEGRVAVQVPASWRMQRITAGPGSARVQLSAPDDPQTALHLAQTPLAGPHSVAETAQRLREAFDAQPPGVFTDFDPEAVRAGRAVVAYRERRDGRHIDWAVFVDGAVRIAIGCQRPAALEPVHPACDRAVATAHALP